MSAGYNHDGSMRWPLTGARHSPPEGVLPVSSIARRPERPAPASSTRAWPRPCTPAPALRVAQPGSGCPLRGCRHQALNGPHRRWDPLQDPAREHVVQGQPLQVDVADVTVADGQRAATRTQRPPVGAVVNVVQLRPDEVAAAYRALAVHRNDGSPPVRQGRPALRCGWRL